MVYNPGMEEYLIVWKQEGDSVEQEPDGIRGARMAWNSTVMPSYFDIAVFDWWEGEHNPAVATNGVDRYLISYDRWSDTYQGICWLIMDGYGTSLDSGGCLAGAAEHFYPAVANRGGMDDWLRIWNMLFPSTQYLTGSHHTENTEFHTWFDIYQSGYNIRNADIAAGKEGYLIVYEKMSTDTGSRQYIFASKYTRFGVYLPLVVAGN